LFYWHSVLGFLVEVGRFVASLTRRCWG
jgi:hypothetical protein